MTLLFVKSYMKPWRTETFLGDTMTFKDFVKVIDFVVLIVLFVLFISSMLKDDYLTALVVISLVNTSLLIESSRWKGD